MKKYKTYRILRQVIFSVMALFLTLGLGCGKGNGKALNVVTEPPYPPFEYYSGENLVGIDIDIMHEIARRLGYDLKFTPISFDLLLKTVASGEANAGISCITITEERSKDVAFSIPYVNVSQVVMVPLQSPIRRIEHLQGKQIGVQESTTGEDFVKKEFGEAVSYPNIEVATDALANGKIDALVLDNITAEDIVTREPIFRLLSGHLTQESYGIAVNKGDPELLNRINAELTDMLNSGWVARTIKKHVNRFGTHRPQVQTGSQLKIGIVPMYPPYESKKNGQLEGIDVDIIHYVCDELGVVPLFFEIGSDVVYSSICSDDVTISISSLTITEERKKLVDFSIPYSEASQRILVKKQSAFRTKEDLKDSLLGVVAGTTSEDVSLTISSHLERYSEPQLLQEALSRDEIDAVVLDDFMLLQLLQKSEEFRLLPDVMAREEYGIAVSKKEPELLKKINAILLKMKNDGTLKRIHEKHQNKPNATPTK